MPNGNRSGRPNPPTARELEVAAAIVRTGCHKDAAVALGISRITVRHHVAELIYRTGSTNGFLGVLVALGWLRVPDAQIVRNE